MASDKRACVQLVGQYQWGSQTSALKLSIRSSRGSISDGGIVFLTLVCGMNMVAARIKPKPVCLMPSEKRACVQLASYCRACVSGTSRYHYSGIEKGLSQLWNDHGVSTVFKDTRQTLKVLNIQHSVLFLAFKTGLKTVDENSWEINQRFGL